MSKKFTVSVNGAGTGSLLLALFVGLKLTGHIDWSWWWVLSPAWFGFAALAAIVLACLVPLALVFAIDGCHEWKVSRRRKKARARWDRS